MELTTSRCNIVAQIVAKHVRDTDLRQDATQIALIHVHRFNEKDVHTSADAVVRRIAFYQVLKFLNSRIAGEWGRGKNKDTLSLNALSARGYQVTDNLEVCPPSRPEEIDERGQQPSSWHLDVLREWAFPTE